MSGGVQGESLKFRVFCFVHVKLIVESLFVKEKSKVAANNPY